jgi:hypothetical protein
MGHYVQSDRRHFRQQSDYTICMRFEQPHGWFFASHQSVLDQVRSDQDFLWRFDLPSSERVNILGALDGYNLNAYSLFDSQETLLETMWFREGVLKEAKSGLP